MFLKWFFINYFLWYKSQQFSVYKHTLRLYVVAIKLPLIGIGIWNTWRNINNSMTQVKDDDFVWKHERKHVISTNLAWESKIFDAVIIQQCWWIVSSNLKRSDINEVMIFYDILKHFWINMTVLHLYAYHSIKF